MELINRNLIHPQFKMAEGVKGIYNTTNFPTDLQSFSFEYYGMLYDLDSNSKGSFGVGSGLNNSTISIGYGNPKGFGIYSGGNDDSSFYINGKNGKSWSAGKRSEIIHRVLTYNISTKEAKVYVKGVLIETFIIDFDIIYSNIFVIKATYGNSIITRLFNYALSQEEVTALYNNGKPNEYRLSNENYINKNYLSKRYKINITKIINEVPENVKYVRFALQGTDQKQNVSEYIPIDNILIKDIYIINNVYSKNRKLSYFGYDGNKTYLSSSIYGIFEYTIQTLGCIAEYLPSSITPTTWFDTSGQENHLTATGDIELIYEKPYQEIIYTATTPTVTPDFIGQKCISDNGNYYISNGVTDANNWIKINK